MRCGPTVVCAGCLDIVACTQPAATDIPGYFIEAEISLHGSNFSVIVMCNDGYAGEPNATVCTTEGGTYSLQGCDGGVYCF